MDKRTDEKRSFCRSSVLWSAFPSLPNKLEEITPKCGYKIKVMKANVLLLGQTSFGSEVFWVNKGLLLLLLLLWTTLTLTQTDTHTGTKTVGRKEGHTMQDEYSVVVKVNLVDQFCICFKEKHKIPDLCSFFAFVVPRNDSSHEIPKTISRLDVCLVSFLY